MPITLSTLDVPVATAPSQIDILAVVHNTGIDDGVAAISALMTYYGREDVPIGIAATHATCLGVASDPESAPRIALYTSTGASAPPPHSNP
jgi:hypothetical protein